MFTIVKTCFPYKAGDKRTLEGYLITRGGNLIISCVIGNEQYLKNKDYFIPNENCKIAVSNTEVLYWEDLINKLQAARNIWCIKCSYKQQCNVHTYSFK